MGVCKESHCSHVLRQSLSYYFCHKALVIEVDWLCTNFPFLWSDIPSSLAYGVFMSQLIQYVWACSSFECFIPRTRQFSRKLLKQGYLLERLKSSSQEVFWSIWGSYSAIWSFHLTNVKGDLPTDQTFQQFPWPWYWAWPSLNYEWFPWSICNGFDIPAGNAYPFWIPVSVPPRSCSNCWPILLNLLCLFSTFHLITHPYFLHVDWIVDYVSVIWQNKFASPSITLFVCVLEFCLVYTCTSSVFCYCEHKTKTDIHSLMKLCPWRITSRLF